MVLLMISSNIALEYEELLKSRDLFLSALTSPVLIKKISVQKFLFDNIRIFVDQ